MSKLLQFKNVSSGYGQIQVLNNISLDINTGEIVTLIGANGAGKTTLLMTLFGCPRLNQGNITFAGDQLNTLETHDIAKRQLTLVPEGRRIFPNMTVHENLLLGLINIKKPKKSEIEWIYTLFPILKKRYKQSAGTLSGGEQQMLAIGRGLIAKPKLLLLDEPSLGLAPIMVQHIFKLLKDIATQGTTLFLVEQNAYQALTLADRGYVMNQGCITLSGRSETLINNPKIKQAYLGEPQPLINHVY